MLNSTSPEAQQAFDLVESYTEAFKNFGFTDEETHKKATGYIGALYLIQGAYGLKNAQMLVKQFGKDVAKPSVTTLKGNNTEAGNNWTADKTVYLVRRMMERLLMPEKVMLSMMGTHCLIKTQSAKLILRIM
ncbi:hypothetical protein ACRBF7_002321 [Providencia stuartii]|uniref:hypothetical protein n=1 Tax=Providencia stuartii TaxID=588 RepID=UPI000C998A45|nr:hypothetical protein [Providencia stuartii]HEM8215405.1 hypothetical protein [Providencia stuartii]